MKCTYIYIYDIDTQNYIVGYHYYKRVNPKRNFHRYKSFGVVNIVFPGIVVSYKIVFISFIAHYKRATYSRDAKMINVIDQLWHERSLANEQSFVRANVCRF